ncbi:hypothetical protein HY095_05020 [Candidatus Micrarchaeota archaeon]|nr:hypothetical protein [Candidatus Micrarchaeota archaeon]
MGFLDFLSGREQSQDGVFRIHAEFHPYSLKPHANDYLDLEVTVENTSREKALTSVKVVTEKGIGVDMSAISQTREVRMGEIEPGGKKFVKTQIWGTQRTEKGTYSIDIYAVAHERDYAHVRNQARKPLTLRVE